MVALGLCVAWLDVAPAAAQAREDGIPAESMGLADNWRASVWGPAALFVNPAGMSRVRKVIFQASYGLLDGKDGHTFGASAVDAQTSQMVALGAGYQYVTSAPGGVDRDGHQFRSALSTGYVARDVSLYAGFGLRYLGLQIGAEDNRENAEKNDVDAWTVDAGLILEIGQRIRFGVVGQNLLDTESPEAARKLGIGLGFTFEQLEVSADMELDLTGDAQSVLRYGFGAQYVIAGAFQVRTGVLVDQQRDEERIAAGIGYSTAQFSIDLGYSTAVADPSDMLFGLSFRYTPALAGGGR